MFAKRFILVVTWIYGPAAKQTGKHTHTRTHTHAQKVYTARHTQTHTQSHRVCVCGPVVRLCFLFALNPRTEALKSMLHFLPSLCRRERICNERRRRRRRRRLHSADLLCSALLCSLLWQFFSMFASVWPAPLCWILIKINYIKCS